MDYSVVIHDKLINKHWPQGDAFIQVKRELASLTENDTKQKLYEFMSEAEAAEFSDECLKKFQNEFSGLAESELQELMVQAASAEFSNVPATQSINGHEITQERQPALFATLNAVKVAARTHVRSSSALLERLLNESSEPGMLLLETDTETYRTVCASNYEEVAVESKSSGDIRILQLKNLFTEVVHAALMPMQAHSKSLFVYDVHSCFDENTVSLFKSYEVAVFWLQVIDAITDQVERLDAFMTSIKPQAASLNVDV